MSADPIERPSPESRRDPSPVVGAALAFGIVLLVFQGVKSCEFVNWDDPARVAGSPALQRLDGDSLYRLFTTFVVSNYTPVEQLSYAVDFRIWGMDPAGFHLTNLVLHAGNAALVFLLALRLFGMAPLSTGDGGSRGGSVPWARWAGALVAALLFALHPLRVESVAWVSERRDVLSLFALLLCALAHLAAVRAAPFSRRRSGWRAAAWLLFAVSLLSKASGVALPIVLLLLDYYPLKRFSLSRDGWRSMAGCAVEKIPFLVLALAAGLVAIHGQVERGAMISAESYPPVSRVANACVALVFYIQKWLVPVSLYPIYPRAPHHPSLLEPAVLMSAAWLVLVTGWLIARRRRWPGALVAWLAFVVMILPFTGLLQAGNAMAADRYTCLSMVPLAVLVGAGFSRLAVRFSAGGRLALGIGAAVVLAGLGGLTVRQIAVWRNSASLWEYALREVPHEFIPLGNASSVLAREGRYHLARVMAREALRGNPRSDVAWHNLGIAAAQCGLTGEAIGALARAVRLNPAAGDSHFELAKLLHRERRFEEARAHYFAAVQAEPSNERLTNLGMVLDDTGHPAAAIKFLVPATLNGYPQAYLVWASILIRHGEYDRARALLALGYRFTGEPSLRILQRRIDAAPRKAPSPAERPKPRPAPKKKPPVSSAPGPR